MKLIVLFLAVVTANAALYTPFVLFNDGQPIQLGQDSCSAHEFTVVLDVLEDAVESLSPQTRRLNPYCGYWGKGYCPNRESPTSTNSSHTRVLQDDSASSSSSHVQRHLNKFCCYFGTGWCSGCATSSAAAPTDSLNMTHARSLRGDVRALQGTVVDAALCDGEFAALTNALDALAPELSAACQTFVGQRTLQCLSA